MRYCAYYSNTCKKKFSICSILKYYWLSKYNRLSMKLGFSIGVNSLGYGAVIPHYGTIVINSDARIGNFSVIHTCTCVAGGKKIIGDYFYLSTGSQIVGSLNIGNGVTIAAHSLVNSSCGDNCLMVGAPAVVKRNDYPLWTNSNTFKGRMESVNLLREVYLNE